MGKKSTGGGPLSTILGKLRSLFKRSGKTSTDKTSSRPTLPFKNLTDWRNKLKRGALSSLEKTREVGPELTKLLKMDKEQAKAMAKKVKRFNYGKVADALFSPKQRQSVHYSFLVICLIVSTYLAGVLLARLGEEALGLGGVVTTDRTVPAIRPTEGPSPQEVETIAQANLFKLRSRQQKKKEQQEDKQNLNEVCKVANKKSSLPINLVSTLVMAPSVSDYANAKQKDYVKSMASVQVRNSRDLKNVREGEKIDQLAKVDRIERLKIIIRNLQNNSCESIQSKNFKKRKKPEVLKGAAAKTALNSADQKWIEQDGNTFQLKKDELCTRVKSDLPKILNQAGASIQNTQDGNTAILVKWVNPGSIFSVFNIQGGDVITKVNGQTISNLGVALGGLQKQLSNCSLEKLSLTVERGGSEQTYDFNVVE